MKNLLIFLFVSTLSFAQNKKEQIEILNLRVDSLINVLSAERNTSSKEINSLNMKIKDFSNELIALKKDLSNLQTLNRNLNLDNDKLQVKIVELTQLNSELEEKLTNLTRFEISPITVFPEWYDIDKNNCVGCVIYPYDPFIGPTNDEEENPLFIMDIVDDVLYFILNGEEKKVPFYQVEEFENGYRTTYKGSGLLINFLTNYCGFGTKRCVSLEIYKNDNLVFSDESMMGFW